ESHCDPDCAWSDRNQQVPPAELSHILDGLVRRDVPVPADSLSLLRDKIDSLDGELLEILAKRMDVSREIGRYKKEHNVPVVQPGRYGDIMASRILAARDRGMSEEFMRAILSAIHEESVRLQVEINREDPRK
ncbi:MAG: chorismate mutase, partial [Duncaniella sp.]|nr:chorismate mutase [Duncaniella sp.]